MYENTEYVDDSTLNLMINRTWKPQLTVTGVEGYPSRTAAEAGNIIIPKFLAKLSVRTPPTLETMDVGAVQGALNRMGDILTANPPYSADVKFTNRASGNGWNDKGQSEWLDSALEEASVTYFGQNNNMMSHAEGGSIPLMGLLSDLFTNAEFIITGVLGPGSNAHAPDESLDIPYCKKLTQCMAHVLERAAENAGGAEIKHKPKKFKEPKVCKPKVHQKKSSKAKQMGYE